MSRKTNKITTNWAAFEGHAVIAKNVLPGNPREGREIELVVDKISPSGERVRFRNLGGTYFWTQADEYVVVEDLGDDE
jgi:hypothetical protein